MAAEAKEGIKWPDKTPERLQDLCVFYVVNNIRRILGSIADKLIRTGNTTLSHVLGNQLLDYLINCCLPNISYLNRNQIEDVQIFFNKKFAGVSRIELHRCNIQTLVSLSVLEALKEHRLNEIALHCALSENEVAAFSSLIQSQINSLNKLTIPDTPGDTLGQIFFSKEQNHPQKSAREPDVVRELTAQLSSMTNLESRGQEPSSSHGKPKEKMLIFPKLTALYLYKYDTSLGNSSFGDVLLKHKTLSSCGIYKTALLQDQSYPRMEPIPSKILESLLHLADLSSLCLVQSSLQSDAFEYLAALQNLRHLDLSFCVMENGEDIEPNHMHLVKLVQRIPKLVSLDISCTKFGGIMQSLKSQGEGEQGEIAVLPGLEGRWFEFLGLWQVIPDVCGLQDIPAKKITGTACEEQIISALYIYQNNIPLLKEVLAHIKNTQLYEPENPYQMLNGVQLCLRTLQSQTEEALVVEVFFQLFSKCYMHIPQNQRREILVLILIIINKNKQPTIEQIRRVGQVTSGIIYPDQDLMQYLIYTLCTGYFAHTAIYSYCFEQYVDTLCTLLCLMNPYYGGSCQYTVCGANLLNHACAIGLDYKILIGEMGIIQRLLEIMLNVTDFLYMQLKKIFLLLPRHLFPFLSELWNILWNLTDEAPENSARFCSNGGVSLFTKTVQILRDGNFFSTGAEDTEAQHQTARCMIGTLGNVSEVQSQRTQLMNKDCIMAVRFILQHNDEKIDIDTSIFCVYILLHMLSFRLDKWMDESISPFDVLEEVRKVMLLWDVRAKRKTTYTSLLPIITLLECQASPREESQYVAAWILCNLTTVNAEVYCHMLRREHGEEVIRRVYNSLGENQEKTKKLLTNIMLNMRTFFTT